MGRLHNLLKGGAGDRDRTGTGLSAHGILSPRRLPIPPLRPQKTGGDCNIRFREGQYSNPKVDRPAPRIAQASVHIQNGKAAHVSRQLQPVGVSDFPEIAFLAQWRVRTLLSRYGSG